jgi:hypothetical protein
VEARQVFLLLGDGNFALSGLASRYAQGVTECNASTRNVAATGRRECANAVQNRAHFFAAAAEEMRRIRVASSHPARGRSPTEDAGHFSRASFYRVISAFPGFR